MKRYIIILTTLMLTAAASSYAARQDEKQEAQISDAMQIKLLSIKKDKLKSKLLEEEALRNRIAEGVAPEAMEEANERQDSICLALRSEIVDIDLQIEELDAAQSVQDPGSAINESIIEFLNGKKESNESEESKESEDL